MIFDRDGTVVVTWGGPRPGQRVLTPSQARTAADNMARRAEAGRCCNLLTWLGFPYSTDTEPSEALQMAGELCAASVRASTWLAERAVKRVLQRS